jgi:NIPSNAP
MTMPAYFQATIELHAEHVDSFCQVMRRIVPIVEAAGWKLLDGFLQCTGRLNTAIDIWELPDMNHYERGLQALAEHPDFAEISALLARAVQRETVAFMNRASYLSECRQAD